MSNSKACTICHRPIVLVPSAAERARRYGGKAEDYIRLFDQHPACTVAKRSQQASETARRHREAAGGAAL